MATNFVGSCKLTGVSSLYGRNYSHTVNVSEDYMNIYVSVEPALHTVNYIHLRVQRIGSNGNWNTIESKIGRVEGWTPGCYCDPIPWHTQFNNYGYKNDAIRVLCSVIENGDPNKVLSQNQVKWIR